MERLYRVREVFHIRLLVLSLLGGSWAAGSIYFTKGWQSTLFFLDNPLCLWLLVLGYEASRLRAIILGREEKQEQPSLNVNLFRFLLFLYFFLTPTAGFFRSPSCTWDLYFIHLYFFTCGLLGGFLITAGALLCLGGLCLGYLSMCFYTTCCISEQQRWLERDDINRRRELCIDKAFRKTEDILVPAWEEVEQWGLRILFCFCCPSQITMALPRTVQVSPVSPCCSVPLTTEVLTQAGTCAICLTDWVHGDELACVCPSSHIFHPSCIEGWTSRGNSTCPCCKQNLFPEWVTLEYSPV